MSADVRALEEAYLAAKARQDEAYWRFTRTARGTPFEAVRLAAETSLARRVWLDARRKIDPLAK